MRIILNAMSDDTMMDPANPEMEEGTEIKPEGAKAEEGSEVMPEEPTE